MNTVLITGASRGIGYAIAQSLSMKDSDFNTIILVARDGQRLNEARNELAVDAPGKTVHGIIADLGTPGFEKALFDEIEALELNVTAIVNNAGYTAPCAFNEITDLDLDLTMQINFKAPIVLIREARLRGHGLKTIVNIASTAGMNGRPEWTVYSASKAALLAASESMFEEFKHDGIDVLRLSPGRCATDLRKVLAPDEDPASIMQPSGVAQSLKFLLSEQGRHLRQQNLVVR